MILVLNETKSKLVLANNYVGYLGYIYNNEPYIAPITYYYNPEKNIVIGYSDEGHKIKAMRENKNVCLEVAEVDSINHWESAQIHGTFNQVYGSTAKAYLHEFSLGIKHLITRKEKQSLNFISDFSSKITDGKTPVVFTISVDAITGRMRRK